MPDQLHSRERYTPLARDLGGYFHPWQRELSGPDPYFLLLTLFGKIAWMRTLFFGVA